MSVPFIRTSFAAGELSPSLFGHVDLQKFSVAASTMRNMWVSYRGGAYSRAGTAFVGFSKQTGRTVPPRLVTFQFSINQGLALEFGNFYMRVVSDGAFVTETPEAITGATQADPCVLTVPGNAWNAGDWIYLSGISGMTQLNGRTLVVGLVLGGGAFQLQDVYGNPVDATQYGAYNGGGTAARIFTLVTPYAEADLEYLKFTQSADVMSLTCWNQATGTSYPPQDLERLADDDWTLASPTFAPTITAPTGLSGSASSSGSTDYEYVVTAVADDGTESVASNIANIGSAVNIAATAGTITLDWSPVTGATSYNVYKALPSTAGAVPVGSLMGFAGLAYGVQFQDSNITPDMTQVPPLHENPFAPGQILAGVVTAAGGSYTQATISYTIASANGTGAVLALVVLSGELVAIIVEDPGEDYEPGDTITIHDSGSGAGATATLTIGPETGTYPSVVSYFQERRVYASSPNNPDTYWMSQPGAFLNFDSRVPTIDDDAITGTPWSVEVNGIQALVPMPGGLVVLTGLSAWQVTGEGGSSLNPQPITPSSQQAQPQAYNGCSATVPPVKIDYDILYVQAKGSIVRDLAYNYWINIYTGIDLTELSSHLFLGYTIREWAWCEEPYKLLYAVRDDGVLLSLTFLKQQEVSAWARHDTAGSFESVCAVTEPPVDALYVATSRQLGANTAYLIERMDNRIWPDVEACWCVDAGLSLGQPSPQAILTVASATGLGALSGVTDLIGGAGYSPLTTASVVDDNGEGPGEGATVALTIAGGVITGVNFPNPGQGYLSPALVIADPSGQGSGASATVVLNNTALFATSMPVFAPTSVGSVLRAGGGKAVVTQYIDAQHAEANITAPMTGLLVPNGNGATTPQAAGSWTLMAPVTTISGLWHLAGATVTGLADGAVIPPTVVSAQGTIVLGTPASAVTIGLGFMAQLQSVYLEAGQPTIQGQRKKIAAVTARLEASRDVVAGANQVDGSTLSPMQLAPEWQELDAVPNQAEPPFGSNIAPLFTGDARLPLKGGFAKPGQVALQQSNPLPMQVLALIPEILPGDEVQIRAQKPQGRRAA